MSSLPPAESVDTLDQLVHVIDLAADKHGVEKVRTAGASYFAVAGLSTPHIDHRQRGLAFARDLQEIIERFRRDNDVDLQIRIGIASGAAVSGVIGRHKLAFDIWGQPVGESEMLNAAAAPGEIRVTQEFADNLKDVETFVPPPNREKPGLLLSQSGATVSASKKPGPARKRKAGRKAGSESKSTS